MTDQPFRLLVVCTANQCRSPIAEALARREVARRGIHALVESAGTNAVDGRPATIEMVRTAQRMGLDLTEHRSQGLTSELVSAANVIVTMERRHIVELAATFGAELHRTYTLPELARLTGACSARTAPETIEDWLLRIGAGRNHQTVLGSATEEVPDPIGQSMRRYRKTAALLEALIASVTDAAFPAAV